MGSGIWSTLREHAWTRQDYSSAPPPPRLTGEIALLTHLQLVLSNDVCNMIITITNITDEFTFNTLRRIKLALS